jgi:hypothetical protein
MPRVQWPFQGGRPVVPVALNLPVGGQSIFRNLLADTGAGEDNSGFELLLEEHDCLLCGGKLVQAVTLGGSYVGSFPVYRVRVQIPALGFDQFLRAVGVPTNPPKLGGIACFRFLNQFTYGNFGDSKQFGLET